MTPEPFESNRSDDRGAIMERLGSLERSNAPFSSESFVAVRQVTRFTAVAVWYWARPSHGTTNGKRSITLVVFLLVTLKQVQRLTLQGGEIKK